MSNRKNHWQNVYHDKNASDVAWFQSEPTLSLALIKATNIEFNSAIIDVGGGMSLLVDCLLELKYSNITVLDISENALLSSKKRIGDSTRQVNWLARDITDFIPKQKFSLWHDRAVFHFLTEKADQKKYVFALKQALATSGRLIIAAFAFDGPTKCSGLNIVQYDANKLSQVLGDDFEFISQQDEIHTTPSGIKQHFSYYQFQRK